MRACVHVPTYVPEQDQRRLPSPSQSVLILGLFFAQRTVRHLLSSRFCVSAVCLAWGK